MATHDRETIARGLRAVDAGDADAAYKAALAALANGLEPEGDLGDGHGEHPVYKDAAMTVVFPANGIAA